MDLQGRDTLDCGHHWYRGYVGPVFVIFQCIFVYIPLSYPRYAAFLFAGNDFTRSAFALPSSYSSKHVRQPGYRQRSDSPSVKDTGLEQHFSTGLKDHYNLTAVRLFQTLHYIPTPHILGHAPTLGLPTHLRSHPFRATHHVRIFYPLHLAGLSVLGVVSPHVCFSFDMHSHSRIF